MVEKEYVLGTDVAELRRLHFQHVVWTGQGYALWQRAGLRAGQTVLDLGCGPGFTSYELAQMVGASGKVIARDQSAGFIEYVAAERTRRGLAQIEPSLGPVETLDIPDGSLDAVYARWLFCWLVDPGAVLERVARAVKPGGVVILQEYLDWAAMKLVPRDAAFDRIVAACMQSWPLARANIDVAELIPAFARRSELEVESFQPIARIGRVGSLEWRWLSTFFENYLPKLVASRLLTEREMQDGLATLAARGADDARFCVGPTMSDIVLRKV
jgi:ubiquinone/menaquinone biosynthesis C-methylase UbiE